jgi:hypothetical protein
MLSKPFVACLLGLVMQCGGEGASARAANNAGRVEFDVFREGHVFGRQRVMVTMQGGELVAQSDANLHAGLGPITFFSYTQRCNETWREGALVRLRCLTRQNGRDKRVEARLVDGAMHVDGTGGAIAIPAATLPTSWWTRPPLTTREMINTETGARLPVRVSFIGREIIDAHGARVPADHIRVQGTLAVDLWYDDQGHWVGCAFTAQGQHVTYRLATSPLDAPA